MTKKTTRGCAMDFVKDLGDTSNTLEVPVDGIGRVELYCGRARVTLVRASLQRDGLVMQPAICVVWTVAAWRACHNEFALMHKLVSDGVAPVADLLRPALLHH
jgi:hypothetical protein